MRDPSGGALLNDLSSLFEPEDLATVPFRALKKERRASGRYLVKWRAKVILPGGSIHHGVTNDLSESGAAIHMGHNLGDSGVIRLHLIVPPVSTQDPTVTVEIFAEWVYSVLDSKEKLFRAAFKFVGFSRGKDAMIERLARTMPAPAPIPNVTASLGAWHVSPAK